MADIAENSVQNDEQFGDPKKSSENTQDSKSGDADVNPDSDSSQEVKDEIIPESTLIEESTKEAKEEIGTASTTVDATSQVEHPDNESVSTSVEDSAKKTKVKKKVKKAAVSEISEHDTKEVSESRTEAGTTEIEIAASNEELLKKLDQVDLTKLSKEELIEHLEKLINLNEDVFDIKDNTDLIKINFYKKHKQEVEQKRKLFMEEGGKPEDFKTAPDPLENEFKELLRKYKERKALLNHKLDQSKQENLKSKYEIIEELKNLINRKESINKTFQEFRELQSKWHSIGLVPQSNVKDLWDTYHHHVEAFYDYIKINQELRDLDLKKNLEAKIELCEKAEDLLLDPNIIEAHKTLQKFHDSWREIGPVHTENRSEIWDRFKEATRKLNKKHQDYFDGLKAEQKGNLEKKTLLCDKAEEIVQMNIVTARDWDEKSKEILELQKVWRTIGFAPKKDNNQIYDRFRAACDNFFERKREFNSRLKVDLENNLQLKTDLCVQAEVLKDSTDWKRTSEELIKIQKHWKEIGPVPKKHSDVVWKRFRAACDTFFHNKEKFYSSIDSRYEDNLKRKLELIENINKLDITKDVSECSAKLKEYQHEWSTIGFVPIKQKDEIQEAYKKALNSKYDALKIDDKERNILKYRTKVSSMMTKPKASYRLHQEHEKYVIRLKKLESDISIWENNIGFFAKSKNAEQMKAEFEVKIRQAKEDIKLLKDKIRLVEDAIDGDHPGLD